VRVLLLLALAACGGVAADAPLERAGSGIQVIDFGRVPAGEDVPGLLELVNHCSGAVTVQEPADLQPFSLPLPCEAGRCVLEAGGTLSSSVYLTASPPGHHARTATLSTSRGGVTVRLQADAVAGGVAPPAAFGVVVLCGS
jgi:hypothetical protein